MKDAATLFSESFYNNISSLDRSFSSVHTINLFHFFALCNTLNQISHKCLMTTSYIYMDTKREKNAFCWPRTKTCSHSMLMFMLVCEVRREENHHSCNYEEQNKRQWQASWERSPCCTRFQSSVYALASYARTTSVFEPLQSQTILATLLSVQVRPFEISHSFFWRYLF